VKTIYGLTVKQQTIHILMQIMIKFVSKPRLILSKNMGQIRQGTGRRAGLVNHSMFCPTKIAAQIALFIRLINLKKILIKKKELYTNRKSFPMVTNQIGPFRANLTYTNRFNTLRTRKY